MKFDFYLSEMSVSDFHGGGLTLQRVLGDDLDRIDHFIHVNRFATDLPASPQFAGRVIDLPSFWDSDTVRKMIGRTVSAKAGRLPAALKQHARKAAAIIHQKFKDHATLNLLVCPQGANAVLVLHELQKLRQVNYITWVMDDHLVKFINGDFVYPRYIEPIYKAHLLNAAHVFVISPAMQQFYLQRFGVKSTVLFGSSDAVENIGPVTDNRDKSLKIGYFGAVALWQHDALAAVKNAIKDTETQLHIYSGVMEIPADLQSNEVKFKGRIPHDEVLTTMRTYDAVLLPISFEDQLRNMSQLNIATKMSEYLACGVPILAIGPPYAAMINYLQMHHAAITITSTAPDDIKTGIGLLNNHKQVRAILHNAMQLVKTEVGTLPMREKWLSVTKN